MNPLTHRSYESSSGGWDTATTNTTISERFNSGSSIMNDIPPGAGGGVRREREQEREREREREREHGGGGGIPRHVGVGTGMPVMREDQDYSRHPEDLKYPPDHHHHDRDRDYHYGEKYLRRHSQAESIRTPETASMTNSSGSIRRSESGTSSFITDPNNFDRGGPLDISSSMLSDSRRRGGGGMDMSDSRRRGRGGGGGIPVDMSDSPRRGRGGDESDSRRRGGEYDYPYDDDQDGYPDYPPPPPSGRYHPEDRHHHHHHHPLSPRTYHHPEHHLERRPEPFASRHGRRRPPPPRHPRDYDHYHPESPEPYYPEQARRASYGDRRHHEHPPPRMDERSFFSAMDEREYGIRRGGGPPVDGRRPYPPYPPRYHEDYDRHHGRRLSPPRYEDDRTYLSLQHERSYLPHNHHRGPPPQRRPSYDDHADDDIHRQYRHHHHHHHHHADDCAGSVKSKQPPRLPPRQATRDRNHNNGSSSLLPPRNISRSSTASSSADTRGRRTPPSSSRLSSSLQPPEDAYHYSPSGTSSAHSGSNSSDAVVMVDISPGVKARLRRIQETMDAVAKDYYTAVSCLACNRELFCIADVSWFLCPDCKVISPLQDQLVPDHHGLGMGFTADTLMAMQSEVFAKKHQHQQQQHNNY